MKIPIHSPSLGFWNYFNLNKAIYENWVSAKGPYVKEFEKRVADYIGVKYASACSSGTAALHLGLLAMGINESKTVLIPAFTMIATAFAVAYTGADIVVQDVSLDTWNMDDPKLDDEINLVIPVHMYGKICKNIDNYGGRWKTIEDACEALGAKNNWFKAGGIGSCAAFSFYSNKTITTGEGGMLVTDDEHIHHYGEYFKDMAFGENHDFIHLDIGYNYRMTNLQAAVGVAQMKVIDKLVSEKIRIAEWYIEELKNVSEIQLPPRSVDGDNIYWMFGVVFKAGSKKDVKECLANKGIEMRDFFYPIHKQPCFPKLNHLSMPNAEYLYENGLLLPSGYGLKREQVKFICKEIINALR